MSGRKKKQLWGVELLGCVQQGLECRFRWFGQEVFIEEGPFEPRPEEIEEWKEMISEKGTFQAQGTASAKTLRQQECTGAFLE